MEGKRTLITIAVFGLAILLWMWGIQWFARMQGWDLNAPPPTPEVVETDPALVDPEGDVVQGVDPGVAATTRPATGSQDDEPQTVTGLRVMPADVSPEPVVLGSAEIEDETFALQITLNPVGAGIDRVVLNDFAQTVESDARYEFERPYGVDPDATRPLATRSVTFGGQTYFLNDVPWRLQEVSDDGQSVTYAIDIGEESGPVLTVEKQFKVFRRDESIGGTPVNHGGYEVLVRERFFNHTDRPLAVRTTIQGPTTPPRELETGFDRSVIRGELTGNGIAYEAEQVESFDVDDPTRTYEQGESNLMWAGTGTIYFNAVVRPIGSAAAGGEVTVPAYLDRVVAEAVNPTSSRPDRRVALRFETKAIEVPAATEAGPGRTSIPLAVFLGPKKRSLLQDGYYSAANIAYDTTLTSPFGCTWCVFQPVVDILVLLLNAFHFVFRDWGLAIIALVVVVRVLLHPITKRSQKNLMRLSKMAPKLQKIKEKYGDDREKMAQAMAEVAPEQTSALLFGCLPMLLQTPIWIALYSTLQATIELRQAPLLYGWTWIDDLASPDRMIAFSGPVPIIPDAVPLLPAIAITGINVLPILMGVVFYLNIKLQPQPTTALSDEQRRQQKMIQIIMVAAFPLFLYLAPSGLNLYILTSTTIGIIETKLIRRNLEAQDKIQEELEAEAKRTGKPLPKKEPGYLAKRFAAAREELQRRTEEAQRQQAKAGKGRGK
jgi:YidC/Oxa1 family membrane protein insertase